MTKGSIRRLEYIRGAHESALQLQRAMLLHPEMPVEKLIDEYQGFIGDKRGRLEAELYKLESGMEHPFIPSEALGCCFNAWVDEVYDAEQDAKKE